jgi:hypothetical protein
MIPPTISAMASASEIFASRLLVIEAVLHRVRSGASETTQSQQHRERAD